MKSKVCIDVLDTQWRS